MALNAELTRIREQVGVARIALPYSADGFAYLITRYADVREVLANSADFPIAPTNFGDISDEEAAELKAGALMEDGPDHNRLRRLLAPAFGPRRIRQLEPRIAAIVDAALDVTQGAGQPVDLVETFALPIPSLVICELLGVPYEDRADFQRRARQLVDPTTPADELNAVRHEEREYMSQLVEMARRNPGDDLIGSLVQEHPDEISTAELIGLASGLLLAGHETTANMLALGTLALLRHPEQLAQLRDNTELIEPAIEELLRWLSVAPTVQERIAKRDRHIGDQFVPAGSRIVVSLPAANHDPAQTSHPDHLVLHRGTRSHLGFGHGAHFCLGAPLARAEMRMAFPALIARFPSLNLAVPFEDMRFRASSAVHGLETLHVTF